ncbi:hypothetical protein COK68_29840, partial [Priestia megaterium]
FSRISNEGKVNRGQEGIYRKQKFYSVTISTFYLKHTQYKEPLVSYKWLFVTLNILNHSQYY